jgi:AraC-like DNA-binding protein
MHTETRVLRHQSERGSWELVLRPPDPRLRGYVSEYEGYVERGLPPLRQQIPTPLLPVIVNFDSPWRIGSSATGPSDVFDSFVAGLGVTSSYVAAAGPARCVQVNLTPLGAHLLFGIALHELANEIVPLEAVFPRHLATLADRLEAVATWDERFALLDAILVARMAEARDPSPDVVWAWDVLERTHGKAPIGWICDRLGRSRRHLAQRFRDQVGLPPKTVARIMRFDHAVSLLGRDGAGLAEVAFECGYYDQAHLNRDFREFAGMSPGRFLHRASPDGPLV